MSIALEARRLCLDRGGRRVLNELSFSVAAGEVYALLGGNGAGKSSTLLAFLGFLEPSSGEVRVQGRPVHEHLREARRSIAYLPESASLYGHLSALENLDYFLDLAGVGRSRTDIETALTRVALESAAWRQRMDGYSKGMRQKVALALALLRETPILLLDEPSSGLDPVAIDELHRLVRQIAGEGRTVLMVTHDVYGACQVANRIGLLREGAMVGVFEAEGEARIDTEAVHAAFVARPRP